MTAADRPESIQRIKAELDQLMHTFLGAFDNTGGRRPNVEVVREVFIPRGMIISQAGAEPVIYDLDEFVVPREKILTDGTLTEFSEWEVAERTEIFGTIAHRSSEYRKSGFLDGEWFEGSGRKITQFVQTPAGWRMSSLAWEDAQDLPDPRPPSGPGAGQQA
ncbi:hypothetical protein EV652_11892 [Kribbella steppae]|uniref:DUF4440 domain-containing protein n=1 Tax=Kribbella steppae TaxID=2512223 RepID=A0A4R2H017_9ACTN|nr:DUF4440 domain-containing protein [Kribbella steppae]TCO17264.1 hypothetical protein EV652_11892 [Kribbella steppae]